MIEINFLGYLISFNLNLILAPGMFIALLITLLSGYPVAFCLGGVAVFFSIIGISLGIIEPSFISALPTGVNAIELTSEYADAIEEFDVTWRFQHFEASGVNF